MMGVDEEAAGLLRWISARGISDAPRRLPKKESSDGTSAAPSRVLGYSLRIATFPDAGGRGLAASRHLKQGNLILRVPKSALMSMHSAKEDPKLARAMTHHPTLSSAQILTVHLLSEVAKGKSSLWHEYLVELPRLHHTLAHFSPFAAQALQVEDARWVAQRAAKTAMMDWEVSKQFMQEIGLRGRFRSLNAWLWAAATVSSRTLHVPWDEAGTLCPVGDLFNYAPPGGLFVATKLPEEQAAGDSESAEEGEALESDDEFSCNAVTLGERLRDGGYEPEFEEYCFYARQAYEPGQQVLLCYGHYSNLELLEHYGFTMGQNPNDVVHLSLPDPSEFGTLSDHLPVNSPGPVHLEVNGTPSFSLLAGLRLRAVPPPLRKARGHMALAGRQISHESDALLYQWLLEKCESLLNSFPTSVDDDIAMIKFVSSMGDLSRIAMVYKSLCLGPDIRAWSSSMSQLVPGDDNLRGERICLELGSVLGACGVQPNDETILHETRRDDHELDRWRLALEWRIGYKLIVLRCSVFCRKKIRRLMSKATISN